MEVGGLWLSRLGPDPTERSSSCVSVIVASVIVFPRADAMAAADGILAMRADFIDDTSVSLQSN